MDAGPAWSGPQQHCPSNPPGPRPRTCVAASSSAMNVACRTSSPSTLASRTRSSGARLLRSMRTNSMVRLLLMSTFAAVVSTQSVSK